MLDRGGNGQAVSQPPAPRVNGLAGHFISTVSTAAGQKTSGNYAISSDSHHAVLAQKPLLVMLLTHAATQSQTTDQ